MQDQLTDGDKTIAGFLRGFAVLKDNQRRYWWVQSVNAMDYIAYSSTVLVALLFLTSDIGWGDVHAGYIFSAMTMGVTVILLVSGFITDNLGVGRSLTIAMAIGALSRGGILVSALFPELPMREWLAAVSMLLIAPGVAMSFTAYQAANVQFSSKRSRGASFSITYLIASLGIVIAGLVVDYFRLGLDWSNVAIFAFSASVCALATLVAQVFIRNAVKDHAEQAARAGQPDLKTQVIATFSSSTFWRFMLFVSLLLGVRAVFVYVLVLFPKYWTRVIGEDVAIGSLYAINPIVIIIGTAVIVPITNRFGSFNAIIVGTFISAFSLAVLALPYQLFSSDVATAYTIMSIVAIIGMSIGEVIWTPKMLQYTAAIAPAGQEGSYLGLSMIPWFFAKLVVSVLSGHMLIRWIPEGVGEEIRADSLSYWESPESLFLWLSLWALSGPVLVLCFRGVLTRGTSFSSSTQPAN